MSNKQQTSVEWLYSNLKSHFEHDGDLLEVVKMSFEQAKAMEKEQIIKSYKEGHYHLDFDSYNPDQYYDETYRGDTIQNNKDKMYSAEEVIKIVEISRTTGLTAEYLIEQFKHKQV
jgi:hypothetical protein